MPPSARFLNPSEAARRLGVSTKALRLYEQRGLVIPNRTVAGWRAYGPGEMARAGEIVALRALGLSLAEVARVIAGEPQELEPALAAHQAALERQLRQAGEKLARVRALRTDLASGRQPDAEALALLRTGKPAAAFDLPWPWGGERFELADLKPLTFIVGPLGSGKTRLAMRLAEELPNARFVGLDRQGAVITDPALQLRVDQALEWLVEDGGTISDSLVALLGELEAEGPSILVIDLVEQGLDHPTQEALIGWLRTRRTNRRPLLLMTRSNAILDLAAVGPDEAIIFCPANHSPPILVAPHPGALGYEALEMSLATPEVRARTTGVIAMLPAAPG